MKKLDGHEVFGLVPDTFEQRLLAGLRDGASARKKPKGYVVAIVIVSMVILAATALGMMRQFGILDFLYDFDRDMDVVSRLVNTDIVQTGGDMGSATFRIREATFSGNVLRFVVVASPTMSDCALIDENNADLENEQQQALQFGSTVHTIACNVAIPNAISGSFGLEREAESIVYGFTYQLPDNLPSTVDIDIHCSVLAQTNTGFQVSETSLLSFTAEKTGLSSLIACNQTIQTERAEITKINIAHSPFEMVASITYKPLRVGTVAFEALDANGHLLPGGMTSGSRTEGLYTDEYAWQTTSEPPRIIPLWLRGTNQIIVLDIQTQEAMLCEAIIQETEEQRTFTYVNSK